MKYEMVFIIVQVFTLVFSSAAEYSNVSALHKGKSLKASLNYDIHHSCERLFSSGSECFQEYLKGVDLSIIHEYKAEDDFDNWIPPMEIQRDITQYMTGFARNGEPVWVYEWGHWRFDKYVRGGKEKKALFEKYNRYLSYIELKSHAFRSTPESRIDQHVVIYDLQGLKLNFLTDRKVLQLQLKLVSDFRRYFEKHISKTIVINVNPISEVLINLMRPFFLRIMDRIEVYGTNKLVWAQELLKTVSKDQLPEWYGGNKGFQPLFVIG